MARPLRIERAGGWYHVTARGNERRPIFRDDKDRTHFLELLAEMVLRFRVRLLVVFVTGLTGFETRAKSTLSGGIDFIAKPILMIELSVKALTHLLRNRAGVRIPS